MTKQRIKCTRCGRRLTVTNGDARTYVCPSCYAAEYRERERAKEEARAKARAAIYSPDNMRYWWEDD